MRLEADDRRHERFWRQLARWLVADAPDRANLALDQERYAPGDEVTATITTFDTDYQPLDAVQVAGMLSTPDGGRQEVAFQPDLTRPGTFTSTFVPQTQGLYNLVVDVDTESGERLGSPSQQILVRPAQREFYDATLKRPFLQRLATASGGFYYTPVEASTIPEQLRGRRTSTSVYRAEPLWDMPFLFGLLLVLLVGEWTYRRRRGLA
jgi:hypothetical protein